MEKQDAHHHGDRSLGRTKKLHFGEANFVYVRKERKGDDGLPIVLAILSPRLASLLFQVRCSERDTGELESLLVILLLRQLHKENPARLGGNRFTRLIS